MAKEKKIMFSYRVPESLYSEISKMVKLRINEYEKELLLGPDAKKEVLIEEKPMWKPKDAKKLVYNGTKVSKITDEPSQHVKPTLEDLYDFELASGFPDQDDCVFVDKHLTACYSKYDLGVYYVKFDGKFLKFTNKKSFEKFSKDNLTPM